MGSGSYNGLAPTRWQAIIWTNGQTGPWTHYTNNFAITIQSRRKFHLAVIQLLVIISQQNFPQSMTVELPCHLQNFVAITWLEFGWGQNEISITFELWWKQNTTKCEVWEQFLVYQYTETASHQIGYPDRLWGHWSLPSMSPVTSRAVIMTPFPFKCMYHDMYYQHWFYCS